ncbi:hypothetical protein [uncultured Modestobacter sp.]|uniref:hypothetical protein n=1 Tax=uncultured Modestobacter sp. TaxID=380048 RepID=UPI0026287445|nr:hypothetical protein [uncultured Modestobacter sp.]
MTRPADEQPTTVLPQQTVEQPSANAAPATRGTSLWHRHVPARIGRARTSTLVIGALFAVLFVLNLLLPRPDSGTTDVVLPSGETVPVPNSLIPSDARTTTTPTPTSTPTAPSTPVPADDGEDEEPVTTPTRSPSRTPVQTSTPAQTTRTPPSTSQTTEDETTEPEPTDVTDDEATTTTTD